MACNPSFRNLRKRVTNNLDVIFDTTYKSSGLSLKRLLSNPDMKDTKGRTLVMRAVEEADEIKLETFIEAGCDVNLGYEGRLAYNTPLGLAVNMLHPRSVQLLINGGVDFKGLVNKCAAKSALIKVWTCKKDKTPPLQYLQMSNACAAIVKMLVAAGANLDDTVHPSEMRPLQLSILYCAKGQFIFSESLFQLLLELGGNPDKCVPQSQRPIRLAFIHMNIIAAKILIEFNCALNWIHNERAENIYSPISNSDLCCEHLDFLILFYSNGCNMTESLNNFRNFLGLECFRDSSYLSEAEQQCWTDLVQRIRNPFSLFILCKKTIRSCLGRNLKEDVKKLGLPVRMHDCIVGIA